LTSSWFVERQELERAGYGDAGVVDDAGESALADGSRDGVVRGGDGRGVGDVDADGREARRGLGAQAFGVTVLADAGEDLEVRLVEAHGAGLADAS